MSDYSNVTLDELKQGTKQYAMTMVGVLREALMELAKSPEYEITFKNKTVKYTADDRQNIEKQLAYWEYRSGVSKYRPVKVVYRD